MLNRCKSFTKEDHVMVRGDENRFQYLQVKVGRQAAQVIEIENVLMEAPVLIIFQASLLKALKVAATGIHA